MPECTVAWLTILTRTFCRFVSKDLALIPEKHEPGLSAMSHWLPAPESDNQEDYKMIEGLGAFRLVNLASG